MDGRDRLSTDGAALLGSEPERAIAEDGGAGRTARARWRTERLEILMRLSVFALLATLVVAPLADASAQASRASRQLFRLEDAWAAALVKRDSSFFRRTLHADYVYSDERGTFTKAQVIAEQVGGTDTVTAASNEDMRAHVHGTAAVVTGILIVSGRGKDGLFAHRYRYTDTWVNDKKGWLMIASQDYEIPRR